MTTHDDGPRWLKPSEFLERHQGRIGRTTLFKRINDGSMPHLRLGRRILIPEDALDRLVTGGEAQSR